MSIMKRNRWRWLFVALVVLFVVCMLWQVIGPSVCDIAMILGKGDEDMLLEYLNAMDKTHGLEALFVLSVVQVLSVVLPGLLVQVAGATLYGWLDSFLICYTGFVFANAMVFRFARKIGNAFVDVDKGGSKVRDLMDKIGPQDAIVMAYMIPGIPNGIVPYVAQRANIRFVSYVRALMHGCWLQILLNCIAGHLLIRGEYLYTVLVFALEIGAMLARGMLIFHSHAKAREGQA